MNYTDEQKTVILSNDKNIAIIASAGCVDNKTEFLSQKGWKYISEYQEGDKVLQYNKETKKASFVYPQQYIKQPDQGLYHIRTKYGVDQCLTLSHRIIYTTRYNVLYEKSLLEIIEIHHKECDKSGFRGRFLTTFDLDESSIEGVFPLNDWLLRVQVMANADGHIRNPRTGYTQVNIKKKRKVERARFLLNNSGIAYSEYCRIGVGYTVFSFKIPIVDKSYNSEYYNCNKEQLKTIIDEVMFWDGDQGKRFSSTKVGDIGFIQYAYAVCGKRTTDGKDIRENRNTCYTLTVGGNSTVGISNRHNLNRFKEYKDGDGYNYCFTVPDSYLVLRRNGRIFITGNSGKSSTMIGRVSDLLLEKKVFPEKILMTSFSRVANKELRERLDKQVPVSLSEKVIIKTIHAICYGYVFQNKDILGLSNFFVVDSKYYAQVIRNITFERDKHELTVPILSKQEAYDKAAWFLSHKKENVLANKKPTNKEGLKYPWNIVFEIAEEAMYKAKKVTFSDLQILFLHLINISEEVAEECKHRFDHLIVDECQDTSHIQFEVLKRFINEKTNTVAVSDSRQTIFSFAGSHYSYLDNFIKETSSQIYPLSETFRFGKKIMKIANRISDIMEIPDYFKTPTRTKVNRNNPVEVYQFDAYSMLNHICRDIEEKKNRGYKYNDMHILYRINKESIPFEKELHRRGIPFRVLKGNFLTRKEIRFTLNSLRCMESFQINELININTNFSNFVDYKTMKLVERAIVSRNLLYDSSSSFLAHAFREPIAGIGPKKKEAFRIMYDRFSRAERLYKEFNFTNQSNREIFFLDLLEKMEIEETDFMIGSTDTGERISVERWSFLNDLKEMFVEAKEETIEEWINNLYIAFSGEDEDDIYTEDRVTLRTIHKSKGCNLPIVYIITSMIGAFDPDDVEDEKFVFYVAVTRASDYLNIYSSNFGRFPFINTLGMHPKIVERNY